MLSNAFTKTVSVLPVLAGREGLFDQLLCKLAGSLRCVGGWPSRLWSLPSHFQSGLEISKLHEMGEVALEYRFNVLELSSNRSQLRNQVSDVVPFFRFDQKILDYLLQLSYVGGHGLLMLQIGDAKPRQRKSLPALG